MAVRVDAIDQERVCRGYVCANCWGTLFQVFSGESTNSGSHIYQITCQTPGCPCRGFVSKLHVEATEFLAIQERYQLWRDLKTALPWVRERGPEQKWDGKWDAEKETVVISNTSELTLAELNAQLGF